MKKWSFILLFIVSITLICQTTIFAEESINPENTQSEWEDTGFWGLEEDGMLNIGGRLRYEILVNKQETYLINSQPVLNLDINYQNQKSEMNAVLNFSDLSDGVEIDEAFIRVFFDTFEIEAGKMKIVWGKGDKIHVIDNLNAEDLSDFINPDYLERKIGENMLKLNYYLNSGGLEFVYTPKFTANQIAFEGDWVLSEISDLQNFVKPLNIDLKTIMPEYNQFEDGQFAVRYKDSVLGFDYGLSYYKGRMRLPSYNKMAIANLINGLYTNSADFIADLNIQYDKVDIFGVEFASIIAGINTKAEFAYYLSEDREGNDIQLHNDKIAWVLGGDKDLPLHNMNLNIQLVSELILNQDLIKNNEMDIDYDENGHYLKNLLTLTVSDKFKNEKILPQISLIYNLEEQDYILDNILEYKFTDVSSVKFEYKIFAGEETTMFGQFDDNDYLSVMFEYDF